MNRYAIIQNNSVENIAVAENPLNDNWILLPDDSVVSVGWEYANGEFTPPQSPLMYKVIDELVTANGEPVTKYAGNYYVNPGDTIHLRGTLTDDGVTPDITMPIALKMPLVRHANGMPTQDEIYLNVTINEGVMAISGTIGQSGDWKILTYRVNQAIERIGAEWKLDHPDITFLV